jgi:integrase
MGRGKSGSGVDAIGGSLRIRFTYNGRRYCETLPLKPTAANTKAAERIAAEVKQKIALGVFDYAATFPNSKNVVIAVPKAHTFADYAPVWLGTLTKAKSTTKGYENAINNFWIPKLGAKALVDIRHTDCATAIAEKAKDATGKTINNLLIPARRLFKAAVADRHIERSPLEQIENLSHQAPEIDPFRREEMDAILAHMQGHYPAGVWNYYQFAFATGVRPSEQIALRWGDVDWNERTIKVRRAWVLGAEKVTKTSRVRCMDVTDFAMEALRRQKAETFMRGPDAHIFCTPEGTPWPNEKRQRLRFFQPTLRASGIRQRVPYNTRHTFATINLMAGINPAYIASQLGHTTTAMLFQKYAKWINGADQGRAAAQMNAAFGPANTPRTGIKLVQEI